LQRAWRRWRRARELRAARRGHGGGSFESRLIWMVGSPRSGSTWLMRMLAEHEAVVPIDEPLIGDHLGPLISDRPGAIASRLDSTNFTLSRLRRDVRWYFFAEEFREVWAPLLGNLIRGRLYAHALSYPARAPLSKTQLIIKEPNGSQAADLIMAALPRAKLLFLLRDGRDVVDSELAAIAEGSWVSKDFPVAEGLKEGARLEFAVQSAHKWLWRTEVVQAAFRSHSGPKHLVRYEDLLEDPLGRTKEVFVWLGLGIEQPELRAVVEKHSFEQLPTEQRGPKEFFRAAQPGLWRQNLSPEEQAAVVGILGPKLRELGYED
jgi:hypothetical protein